MSDSPFEPIRDRVTEPDIVAGNNLWRRHQIKTWRLILAAVLICIVGLGALTAMTALDWNTVVAMAAAILVGTAAALMVRKAAVPTHRVALLPAISGDAGGNCHLLEQNQPKPQ